MLSHPSYPSSRVFLPTPGHIANSNMALRHPAELASWIWHPKKSATETAVLRFHLRFSVDKNTTSIIHVTADQRFQLRCDGLDVTFGPVLQGSGRMLPDMPR